MSSLSLVLSTPQVWHNAMPSGESGIHPISAALANLNGADTAFSERQWSIVKNDPKKTPVQIPANDGSAPVVALFQECPGSSLSHHILNAYAVLTMRST
jgi:hypothetical protein